MDAGMAGVVATLALLMAVFSFSLASAVWFHVRSGGLNGPRGWPGPSGPMGPSGRPGEPGKTTYLLRTPADPVER